MKKYLLILGVVYEADPLTENYITEIQSVSNVIESDDIHELETMGGIHLEEGGVSYKILSNEHDHDGIVWSNKAHNQYNQCMKIESPALLYSLN